MDGKFVGEWGSGLNFRQFNISPYLKNDRENVLAVKVMNHAPRDTQWFDISDLRSFSGIFRDMVVFAVLNVHISNVVFKSQMLQDNSAKVSLDILIGALKNNKRTGYSIP